MKFEHLDGWHQYTGNPFELQLNWMKKPISNNGDQAVELGAIVFHYSEAIEQLFNSIDGPRVLDADSVGLPLLFLVKHALEIGMKHMIYETYLHEIAYGDRLWGKYEEIGEKMNDKKKEVSGLGHNLGKLYSEVMIRFKVLKQKTDIDLEAELNSSFLYSDDDERQICGTLLKSKLKTPVPYFEILQELCDLFSTVLDPDDSAFKYDVTKRNNKPALNVQGDDCINIAMVVCHYQQIKHPLYDITEYFLQLFEEWEEHFREMSSEIP